MSEKDKKGLGDKTSSSTLKWVDYKKDDEHKEKKKSYLDYDYYYDEIYDSGSWYDYYSDRRKRSYSSSLGSSGSSSYYSSSSSSWWKGGSSTYTPPKRESMSSLIGSYSRSFSSSRLSSDDREKLTNIVNSSIKLTREFIAILDLPFKIVLNFVDSSSSCDDGCYGSSTRKLYIPTKVIDYLEKGKSEDVVINTVVGMGIHEAAHMMYTCCNDVDGIDNSLVYFFANLIEDYRVEDCLLKDRPGYQDFISTAMEFRVSLLEEGEKIASRYLVSSKEVCNIFLNTIYLIRYPSSINKEIIKSYNLYFDKIRNLIEKTKLKNTGDSVKLSQDIYNEFANQISPLVSELDVTIERIKTCCRDYVFFSNYIIPILYGKDKVSKNYNAKIDKIIKATSSAKISSTSFKTDLSCCLGEMEEGEERGTFFIKNTKGDKKLYLNIAKNISRFVPMIKKQVMNVEKNTTINIYGCRQGLLDTTKIAEAVQNVPQVYYRTGQVKTSKVSIGVLVDESGSMWGDREEAARDAAILLNEAFGNISGVDLYIYGHTADSIENKYDDKSTDIRVYKEPGFNNMYALTDIQARYENRDGVAILETAKRIRNFTSNPCILFVISDGQPSAIGYRDWKGIEDTKAKVKLVEKMGFEVIQITICNLDEEVKNMFSKSISLEKNLDDLPKELGKVLKKTILENKITTVTW